MKDLKKIQEFFSNPLEEENQPKFKKGDKVTYLGHPGEITGFNKEMTGVITYNVAYDKGYGRTKATNIDLKTGAIKPVNEGEKSFADYSNNELLAYYKNTKDPKAKEELTKRSQKLKALSRTDEAIDINDPVLMKMRAAKYTGNMPTLKGAELEKERAANAGDDGNDYIFRNAKKLADLKAKRKEIMSDMEQEAEPEGGPIADRYGAELNKIDKAIAKLSGQGNGDEYMSKDEIERRAAMIGEGNKEYFKPSTRKDKSNPNFLYIDIAYPTGTGFTTALGSKTMSGQEREAGAAKALSIGNNVAKKLQAKYNIEDIDVSDLKNGKVQVFAVSDDFIEMASPSLDEAKPVANPNKHIKGIQIQLDQLGVKYEMDPTNKIQPFKVIYKPVNKDDDFYDKFNDIVFRYNLKGVVKTSMSEANGFKSGKEFINIKLRNYPKAVAKVNQLINMIGEPNFTMEMAEWIFDFFNNASFESPVNEASKEEETEFHKKLDKLVHSTFGKRKDELEEEVDQRNANSYAYQFMQYFDKMSGIVRHNFGDDTRKEFEKLVKDKFSKYIVNEGDRKHAEEIKEYNPDQAQLDDEDEIYMPYDDDGRPLNEAYVPQNIKEFAKRKGVSRLVNTVAGWAEKVGARITGGTAIGKYYDTLILDMGYQTSDIRINCDDETVELYYEPVNSFADFKRVFMEEESRKQAEHDEETLRREQGLEERIAETLDKINEELCPAGKAYIKRRQAAGEKSSAYLSGRAVKVCKGQMSGRSKKK